MNYRDFIKKEPEKGIYFFIGKEEYLLLKAIEKVKRKNSSLKVVSMVVSKQDELISAIYKASGGSLFQPEELIKVEITRNISFKGKKKREELERALRFVKNYLFLYSKSLYEKSSLVVLFKSFSIPVVNISFVDDRVKFEIVREFFEEKKKVIQNHQIREIIEKSPDELFLLEGELRKIVLHMGERKEVLDNDINEVMKDIVKGKIELFLKSLFSKNSLKFFNELLESGYDIFHLWNIMLSYMKRIYKSENFRYGLKREQIKKALCLAYEYDKKLKGSLLNKSELFLNYLLKISQ